ncbi:type 1 glycerol-3-phosphate oxidase [Aerococcus viridans]|uniref:type 1 glycerol-3-phosphate oxidase n=1 Tax=Aerococcus viridans TaxID=1377 RepID=UPI0028FDBA69|nr:type 1 glycerol-3-phosphate oxidase [Aerococcus viridans]
MPKLSFKYRKETVEQLKENQYDLFIIGGGITGAGVAIQAAASGLKTALVDMQDFSEGTSSRSTKLVHGGIRYLKNFDLEVVSDTVTERATVHNIAPHIPQPDPMLMPLYDEPKVTFNPLRLQIAMDIYDSLAGVKDSQYANEMLSKDEVLSRQPDLMAEGLIGGGKYLDFNNNDSRLVIENIKQANDDGADLLSHAKVVGFEYENDKIVAVKVEDLLSGETFTVKSHVVINTTGPWSDTIRQLDGSDEKPAQMRPTKGVHFVVDKSKLTVSQPIYFDTGEQDGRMVFVLPRENKTYFGTTDTDYTGDFEHPTVTQEDVDYLLRVVNHRFPNANLSINDIEASWAGLRPLIDSNNASDYNGGDAGRLSERTFDELVTLFDDYSKDKVERSVVEDKLQDLGSNTSERGDGSPSSVSRGSDLSVSDSGLFTLAGGKLTDYRKMAKGAMEKVIPAVAELSGKNYDLVQSSTYPVSGGQFDPSNYETAMEKFANVGVARGLTYGQSLKLAKLYGSNMNRVVAYLPVAKEYAAKYDYPVDIAVSLIYALEEEGVYTSLDFFARRTTLMLFQHDKMLEVKDAVSQTIVDHFGLDQATADQQNKTLEEEIAKAELQYLK